MKSLEETIKLKCKFLGNTITPLYLLPPDNYFLLRSRLQYSNQKIVLVRETKLFYWKK